MSFACTARAAPAMYRLAETEAVSVWGCTPLIKVMKDAPLPDTRNTAALLAAARNEYESFQIVLRPTKDLGNVSIKLGQFSKGWWRGSLGTNATRLEWVGYVNVTRPTDKEGRTGLWPDPLIPCAGPRDLKGGENHPLWLTVHVPPGAAGGDYKSTLTITAAGGVAVAVPLVLRVWSFTLPDEFATKTAYGVGVNNEWHQLKRPEDFRQVYDLYLATLARHHLAPYSPMLYYPIKATTKKGAVDYDFAEFDAGAQRYLEGFHFNAFNLDLPLAFSQQPAFPAAYREKFGSHIRPIIEHLRAKGWLTKAYVYWWDEPVKERYAWVKEGMAALHATAPELKRLLTLCHDRAPNETFRSAVDIWCPVMNLYDPAAAAERRRLGEQVWWYVCCGPKAPWPNNFIDHAAVTHRMRYWVMEKYRVEGDLYWNTTYWWQKNPWDDPQAYEWCSTGKNTNKVWGNGDGMLLYPPTRQPPAQPVLDGPRASIRMALIRDGLEDREYFRLLERAGHTAGAATQIVERLVQDGTHYERDPEKIAAAREQLAALIERGR